MGGQGSKQQSIPTYGAIYNPTYFVIKYIIQWQNLYGKRSCEALSQGIYHNQFQQRTNLTSDYAILYKNTGKITFFLVNSNKETQLQAYNLKQGLNIFKVVPFQHDGLPVVIKKVTNQLQFLELLIEAEKLDKKNAIENLSKDKQQVKYKLISKITESDSVLSSKYPNIYEQISKNKKQ